LDHFDEIMFRVSNTTYTVKMPSFSMAQSGRDVVGQWIYNDFPVIRWRDNLKDEYCDNQKAIEALLTAEQSQKVRFHSSTYNTQDDITLDLRQLTELRLAYRMWQLMCKGKADLSFLDSESERDAKQAKKNAEFWRKRNEANEAKRQENDAKGRQAQAELQAMFRAMGRFVPQQQQQPQQVTKEQLEIAHQAEIKKQQETQSKVFAFRLQSATNGLPTAQYQVGMAYLKGEGVETNMVLAVFWLSRAAAQGNQEARNKLDELGPKW
jgi:hypothetical protein